MRLGKQDQQAILKAQIRQIQSSPLLTPKEKAESMQNLMMKNWNASRDKVAPIRVQSDAEVERQRVTYHVRNIVIQQMCVCSLYWRQLMSERSRKRSRLQPLPVCLMAFVFVCQSHSANEFLTCPNTDAAANCRAIAVENGTLAAFAMVRFPLSMPKVP